ncbi:MAG TPA: histidine kinase dimerization/phospho-acceptor domain-containing protein, partial [Ilumatobacteraceae bacterium]|nr:histidine kinase dimerization/phospho-acceptor domain-containing protein [Ilumatobacteraceae bacterium]
MTQHRHFQQLSGVRGRVVLTVLVVTACLYSLLGSIGFLYIADSGRHAIRDRVAEVVDQLEAGLRNGSAAVSITTPDGVEAVATKPGSDPFIAPDDISVRRTVMIGTDSVELVGHASQARLTDSLRSLYRGLWVGVPLGVILTAFIAGLATRRALRPVSVITDLAASIDASDSAVRVPVPETDDEIQHLARTVNEMLDRIAAGRAAQRQFTSDAAHELRTPLMALQGEIELAIRSPHTADEPFLQRLEALGHRLAQRVDDLVLLSTLDEQPPLDLRKIDVVEIVHAEAATMPAGGDAPAIEVVGDPTE